MARHLQAAAKSMKATTNNESRAEPLVNAIAFGEVYIVQASWTAEFIAELRGFPAGKYKDQVDAASLAYLALVEQTVQPRKAIMARMPSEATMCKGGCHRPVEKNAEYCCPCCEAIAAFNDPTMQLKGHEHDQACIQRYFIWTQENPLPDIQTMSPHNHFLGVDWVAWLHSGDRLKFHRPLKFDCNQRSW